MATVRTSIVPRSQGGFPSVPDGGYEQSSWIEISIPRGTGLPDLNRAILSCARLVALRVVPSTAGSDFTVEALCADVEQRVWAETYVQQSLVDQALRRSIREQNSQRIDALVERILSRAGGG